MSKANHTRIMASKTDGPIRSDAPSPSGEGKKPKRVRRKCSHPQCDNRVVQGGVCVTHGARRKSCAHPGCDKAVKLAGYCSTHGPSRRKCDEAGCSRVAVQGGRCLSHGARRKVCNYPTTNGRGPCGKNAILGGYCKKHFDRMADARGMLDAVGLCVPCDGGGTSQSSQSEAGYEENYEDGTGAWGAEYAADPVSSAGAEKYYPATTSPGASTSVVAPVLVSMAMHVNNGYQNSQDYQAYQAARYHQDVDYQGYGHESYPQDVHYHQPLPSPAPPAAKRARHHGHQNQGHNRGLSIFEDMSTVDAIISSGQQRPQPVPYAALSAGEAVAYYPQQVVSSAPGAGLYSYPQAPRSSRVISASSVTDASSTKTPVTQVSFADSCFSANKSGAHRAAHRVHPAVGGGNSTSSGLTPKVGASPPCTGLMSCACNACRSPTLAIFDQMIQASHKLESGEGLEEDEVEKKYAALSPPRLSPRKTGGLMNAGNVQPKDQATCEGEGVGEETSGGTVVRQVSSNNIVGEDSAAHGGHEGGFLPSSIHHPRDKATDVLRQGGRWSGETLSPEDGAMAVGMAISDDISVGGGRGVGGGQSYYGTVWAHDSNLGPPLTPKLTDGDGEDPQGGYGTQPASSTPAVVSSHSSNGSASLLPRRRECINHLFIPKEV